MKYSEVVTNSLCIIRGIGVVKAVHPTYATKKNGDRVAIYPNDRVEEFKPRGKK